MQGPFRKMLRIDKARIAPYWVWSTSVANSNPSQSPALARDCETTMATVLVVSFFAARYLSRAANTCS